MTEEQILKLVKKYFNEGGIRDDGSCSEYYGDPDAFVKFAREMFSAGYCYRKKDEENLLSTTWDDW